MLNNNKILESLSIITLITVIYAIYKKIERKTETKIISDEAVEALHDKEKAIKLRKIVNDYHKGNNKWKEEVNSILE